MSYAIEWTDDRKSEFLERFKAHMLRFGETFSDGTPIADYADMAGPTYWDDPDLRECGPEECADEDIACWDEE